MTAIVRRETHTSCPGLIDDVDDPDVTALRRYAAGRAVPVTSPARAART